MFTVPNQSGSIEDPSGVYPQAQLDSVDLQILAAAVGGANGVSSGCAVTAQGTPDNTVAVAAGTVVVNYVEGSVGGGNVTMTAAHATLPRFDLVVATIVAVQPLVVGTAATTPVFPAIPADSVVLAAIYVDAGDNIINSNQIVDKRVTVPVPTDIGSWTTVSASADQTKTSDTTLANDAVLTFALAANTKYRIRGVIFIDAAATPDWKYAFVGPASPTLVRFSRMDGTGVSAPAYDATDVAYPGSTAVQSSSANGGILQFSAIVHNGANAGTFAFQWAQDTSDAGAVVRRAGSYIEYAVS